MAARSVNTAASVRDAATAALDAALDLRVELHEARFADAIDVALYLHGLAVVRGLERSLEPLRAARHSRAFERAAAELGVEVAA